MLMQLLESFYIQIGDKIHDLKLLCHPSVIENREEVYSYVKRVSVEWVLDQSETGVLEEGDKGRQAHHRAVQLTEVTRWKPEGHTKDGGFNVYACTFVCVYVCMCL